MKKTENNDNNVLFFLKFGSEKNMLDLLNNGTIYFNTIDYFQKLEREKERGDKYEGTTNIKNYHEYDNLTLTLKIPNTEKEIKTKPTKLHLREYLTEIKGNIYSLYSLKTPELYNLNFKIDQRVKEFGTHFVIIKNPTEFLNRIVSELRNKGISFRYRGVNYYAKNKINGKISLFDKVSEYNYQYEFRILLYRNEITPFSIKIGDINNIAEIFEVDAIDKMEFNWIKNKGEKLIE